MSAAPQCYLILVAMEVELRAVVAKSPFIERSVSSRLGIKAYRHESNGLALVVAKTGVGLVSAALTTYLCAEAFPSLSGIVSLGIGGGLASDLPMGSLVVGDCVIQHDCILSRDAGLELMAPGELHLSLPAEQRPTPPFSCDAALGGMLLPKNLPTDSVRKGTILSGNEFVGSRSRKAELVARHPGALLVDMESAGVAQIAKRLGIPFAALKTVADAYSPEADATTLYQSFLDAAAAHAAGVITAFWDNHA